MHRFTRRPKAELAGCAGVLAALGVATGLTQAAAPATPTPASTATTQTTATTTTPAAAPKPKPKPQPTTTISCKAKLVADGVHSTITDKLTLKFPPKKTTP